MGKLDEFFKVFSPEKKRSELEILEEVEDYAASGEFGRAIEEASLIETERNRFLAVRLILRRVLKQLENDEKNVSGVGEVLRGVVPLVNSLTNQRYKALLTADIALILYYLGDEFRGDLSLKTAINLAEGHDDVLLEIIRELVRRGLLEKAAGALKLVRDRDKLDSILVTISEMYYRMGDIEGAKKVVKHIKNPFHKAMALYYMALVEAPRDKEAARALLDAAIKVAERVEAPDARFELILKLYDLWIALEGESIRLTDVLKNERSPQ
ncbi:MAG: hypothetical protein J7L37_08180 [Thermococcus sp.]|nr:hypothetical protein [Thermococcus sp.]